jgi:glucose/arabinose dehydrogenase
MGGSIGKTVLLVVLLVLMCAACDGSAEERGRSDNDIESITTGQGEKEEDASNQGGASVERVEVSILATDLEVPWSIAFLPGGNALVTERDSGRLLRVSRSGDVQEIQTLPEGGSGEGGLLGVAISPDYEDDRHIYTY